MPSIPAIRSAEYARYGFAVASDGLNSNLLVSGFLTYPGILITALLFPVAKQIDTGASKPGTSLF